MTERLDRLERRKLIRRRPAARDRRPVLVELTARGRALFDRARADLLGTEAALLQGLSQHDRSAVAGLLGKLAAVLEREQHTRAPSRASSSSRRFSPSTSWPSLTSSSFLPSRSRTQS
jgi:DNA-binding PadR family transcriptional regulator